eukprot:m.934637 g.934637  ORF g.934637 m.934637 type:complete len:1082 (-) comp23799_c0_seq11:168-3413(-)
MSTPKHDEETGESDDPKICRICRGEQSPDSPLFYPCACTGSIRYIHQDCLQTWLEHSGKRFCELCGTEFKFLPLYSDSMPDSLSMDDLLKGLFRQAISTVNDWSRICLVFLCWGIVFPISARWSWRFLFEVWKFPWEYEDPMQRIGFDCLQGVLVGLLVCGVALGLLALRDFIVANGIPIADPLAFPDEDIIPVAREMPLHDGAVAAAGGDVNAQRRGNEIYADEIRGVNEEADAHAAVMRNNSLFDVIDPLSSDELALSDSESIDMDAEFDAAYADMLRKCGLGPDATDADRNAVFDKAYADMLRKNGLGAHSDGDAVGDDTAIDDALHEPFYDHHPGYHAHDDQHRHPHHDGQHHHPHNFDHHDHGAHGHDGMDEDVPPLEEMVGLVGPLNQLFNNLCLMVVITAVAVFTIAYVPHALGAATLHLGTVVRHGGVLAPLLGTFFDPSEVDYLATTVSTFWGLAVAQGNSSVPELGAGGSNVSVDAVGSAGMGDMNGTDAASSFALCVITGYAVVTALAFLYLAGTDARRGSSPARVLSFFCVFVKICALLTSEVVFCPLLYGWWLDICSLDLQNSTLRSHREFLSQAPWSSSFLHWFAGMLFMHNFAGFIQTLREVLHPRVLWFFRDPNDPQNHAIRQMLEMPLHVYARRLILITIMYGVTVVMVVWLPARTLCHLAPSVLPYRVLVSHPLEMIVFNFGLPVLQNRLNPQRGFREAIRVWCTAATTVLGIQTYMLPAPDSNANTAAAGAAPDNAAAADVLEQPRTSPVGDATDAEGDRDETARPTHEPVLYPTHFRARVLMLLGLAWVCMHMCASFMLVVPITLGRRVLALAVPLHFKVHDFYAFTLGTGMCVAAGMLARPTVRQRLLAVVQSWSGLGHCVGVAWGCCKAAVAVGVGLGVLPLAVGVLLDLAVLVPLRCPADMTPATYLWQDWGIGAMACQLVYDADQLNGGVFVLWRRSVRHVLEGEFRRIDLVDVLLYGVVVLGSLGIALLVPFVLAFAALPQLLLGAEVAMKVSRMVFPGCLLAAAATIVHRWTMMACKEVYRGVRDDKYLVGKRLMNVDAIEQPTATDETGDPVHA